MIGSVLGSAMGENSELPVVTEGDEQGKIKSTCEFLSGKNGTGKARLLTSHSIQ